VVGVRIGPLGFVVMYAMTMRGYLDALVRMFARKETVLDSYTDEQGRLAD